MISPKTIDAVRERTDIGALIGESVKLVRRGRSLVGLCPFHNEKTPSFSVSPDRGFFYCFGCKESGNAFDFLMKLEGLSFPEAVRRLAEQAGIAVEELDGGVDRKKAEAARRALDDLYAVTNLAAHFFETQLKTHTLARLAEEELARRELTDAETMRAFRLGYAPPEWDALATFLSRQGVSPTAAEKVGLLAPRKSGAGHYDWFRNRLMFPVIDVQGRVIGFSGRVLPDPATGVVDKQSPKYINSPESPIYQKGNTLFGVYQARQAIRQSDEAVLVEGNFDVVSLHARGVSNVVAPLGTAFTPAQAKLLRRFTPHVVLLFDSDAAGRKATREARETCREGGLAAKVAVLDGGKDPDEFVRERGVDALRRALRAARGILEHLLEAALDEGYVRGDAHERAARAKEIVRLIASEDDPVVRAMAETYVDTVAQRLGLTDVTSMRALRQSLHADAGNTSANAGAARAGGRPPARVPVESPHAATRAPAAPPAGAGPAPTPWKARSHTAEEMLALDVLGGFLDFPELVDDPDLQETIAFLEGDAALALAAMRQATRQEGGVRSELYAIEFLALVPASIHTFASERLAAPLHEQRDDAKRVILSNGQKLKRRGLSRQRAESVEALHRIERRGDPAAEDAKLREAERLAREKRAR